MLRGGANDAEQQKKKIKKKSTPISLERLGAPCWRK
jgi:hypothetical protein